MTKKKKYTLILILGIVLGLPVFNKEIGNLLIDLGMVLSIPLILISLINLTKKETNKK